MLDSTQSHTGSENLAAAYAARIGEAFISATKLRDEPRSRGKLWASDLGKRCLRQHWYNFNKPESGEKLTGNTKFKFLYGNILEEAVLYYAEEAGHTVTNQQMVVEHELDGWTIRGRIDAIIDDTLVDVKSTSSYGYKRYKDGITIANDSFGYLHQLAFYKEFSGAATSNSGFIWIDKQNGHIHYTKANTPPKEELISRAKEIISSVDKEELDVPRGYAAEPYGKSGNEALPISCSYCPYKDTCWRDSNGGQGLRGFVYNQGPVWFTKVVREPNVPEIKSE